MDGLEFDRGMTTLAFTVDRSFRFGGELPIGQRNAAVILRGWRPRELSPSLSPPLRLRLTRALGSLDARLRHALRIGAA